MRIALVDSDIVAYRAAILTEADDSPAQAVELSDRIHDTWLDAAEADILIPCITRGSNFRNILWPAYKSNRKDKVRPRHLSPVYEHIMKHPNLKYHSGWEADDVLGFMQTMPLGMNLIIVSIDKDLDQIPGWHCNPDKEVRYEVSIDDADLYKWMQVLSGDSTDGYAGIAGIGQGKAGKILADVSFGDRQSVVESVYTGKELDTTYYSAMLKCAEIVQYNKDIECELLLQDSSVDSTLVTFLRSLRR